MTDRKTIVITWTGRDITNFGNLYAALWVAEGTDTDLNAALRYASAQHREAVSDARVHTFPTDQANWKAAALAAHNKGCGL